MIKERLGRSPEKFFVQLRNFASYCRRDRSENLVHFRQDLHNPVRRLVKDNCSRLVFQGLEERPAARALDGQKILKDKSVGGQAACHKRGDERARARHRHHRKILPHRRADKIKRLIRNTRRSRVAHDCHVNARLERFDEPGRDPLLVEIVVGHHLRRYTDVLKQFSRLPRVLGEHCLDL